MVLPVFPSFRYFLLAASGQELQGKEKTKEAEGKEDQKDAELGPKTTLEEGSPKEDQKKPVLVPEPTEKSREAEGQKGEGLKPKEKMKEAEDKDDTGGKGVRSAEAEINQDDGKLTEKTKGSKKTLPGPTWPLDSHPDRVREYLVKWNMLSKVEDKPVEANLATAKDEKNLLQERQRPDGWAEVGDFVQPGVQAPQKPRGRKKKTKNDDGNENDGRDLNDSKPKPSSSRAPKKRPEKDDNEDGL